MGLDVTVGIKIRREIILKYGNIEKSIGIDCDGPRGSILTRSLGKFFKEEIRSTRVEADRKG